MTHLLKVAVLSAFMFASSVAFSQSDSALAGGNKQLVKSCKDYSKALRRLDLTAEQVNEIKGLIKAFHINNKENFQALSKERRELFRVLFSPLENPAFYDPTVVSEAWLDVSAVKEELLIAYGQLLADFQLVLTTEQYIKFIRIRLHIFRCLNAPERIFRRAFRFWLTD